MNKICTSLEQSKKLIELGVDIYTADMCWTNHLFNAFLSSWRIESTPPQEYKNLLDGFAVRGYLIEPCWSLTVLMKLMPKVSTDGDEIYESYPIMEHDDEGFAVSSPIYNTSYYSEPIDAAFEMVCWLKENGKI